MNNTSVAGGWMIETTLELTYYDVFELSIHSPQGVAMMRIGDSDTINVVISEVESYFNTYSYARCTYLTFSSVNGAVVRGK